MRAMALLKRGDDGLVEVAPGCFFDPLTGERRARLPKSKLDYGTSILTLDVLGMSPASGVGPSLARECARTTNSWKEYAEDKHKHVRCKAETTERYAGPVTAAMQFGWNKVSAHKFGWTTRAGLRPLSRRGIQTGGSIDRSGWFLGVARPFIELSLSSSTQTPDPAVFLPS